MLRTATFNTFLGTNWQNQRVASTDFKDLDSRLIGEDPYYLLQTADQAKNLPDLPSFTLRGAAAAESPLPLPGDAAGLRDFELDGIERNSFGTVRVFPKQSGHRWHRLLERRHQPGTRAGHARGLADPLAETRLNPKTMTRYIPSTKPVSPPQRTQGGAIHDAVVNLQLDREPTSAASST